MNSIERLIEKVSSLFSHPMTRATQRLKDAINHLCRIETEIRYHQRLEDFFQSQALALDPHVHWWEFAMAKDCVQHHRQERELEERRLESAQARLQIAKTHLEEVRTGLQAS